MIEIKLTQEEAVKLAGVMGILEGIGLNDVYHALLKGIDNNGGDRHLIYTIADLAYEEILLQNEPHLDEDYLYDEACKLNGLLDWVVFFVAVKRAKNGISAGIL